MRGPVTSHIRFLPQHIPKAQSYVPEPTPQARHVVMMNVSIAREGAIALYGRLCQRAPPAPHPGSDQEHRPPNNTTVKLALVCLFAKGKSHA